MFYEKLQNKIKKCSTFVFTCWKEHKPQRIITNPFCYQEKEQKFDFATIITINVPLQAYLSFSQTGLQEAYIESTNSRINFLFTGTVPRGLYVGGGGCKLDFRLILDSN